MGAPCPVKVAICVAIMCAKPYADGKLAGSSAARVKAGTHKESQKIGDVRQHENLGRIGNVGGTGSARREPFVDKAGVGPHDFNKVMQKAIWFAAVKAQVWDAEKKGRKKETESGRNLA